MTVIPAYLLGTFPTAILVGRRQGHDPTTEGSGNPGASNALRTMGRGAAGVVLVGDVGKGAVAAAAGLLIGGRAVGVASGLVAVLGHVAPVTRGLRGGKGVATLVGAAAVLLPIPMLVLAAVWAVVARITGTASLGSVIVAVGLGAAAAVMGRPLLEVVAFVFVGALVVGRHRDNIKRLRRGEERPLTE